MTIKQKFIDRKDELKYLNDEYDKNDFRFISIIGRRRLGKTRFIEEFLKNKHDYCYFLVPELNDLDARLEVSKKLHESLGISFIGTPLWDDIFAKLFTESQGRLLKKFRCSS
jgi:AAA+ ATPase superfamily predicted ATPase